MKAEKVLECLQNRIKESRSFSIGTAYKKIICRWLYEVASGTPLGDNYGGMR